jgi:hypothetical protein
MEKPAEIKSESPQQPSTQQMTATLEYKPLCNTGIP